MGSWSVDGNHEDGVVDDHGDDDDDCPNVIGSLTMKRFASLMPKIMRALAMVTPYFPTLVVVDDLHWAAAESLDLYRYIVSETPHPLSPTTTATTMTEHNASKLHPRSKPTARTDRGLYSFQWAANR